MITRPVCQPVTRPVARVVMNWRDYGGNFPRLAAGEYFLTDENGAYLIDENGNYLIGKDS